MRGGGRGGAEVSAPMRLGREELCLLPGAVPGPRVLRGQGAGKGPSRHGERHVALSLSLSQPGRALPAVGAVSAPAFTFSPLTLNKGSGRGFSSHRIFSTGHRQCSQRCFSFSS